jgi:glycosyltransferase involved in cell wall biosynthesis
LVYSPATIYYFTKHCSSVAVGSFELQKNLSYLNKNIILNTSPTVDLNIYKKSKNEILTIGWIGCFGGGHKESLLSHFFPALMDLSFKIKLVILGVPDQSEYDFLISYFQNHKNVELEIPMNIDWQNEEAIQQLIVMFDIGIATLLDDELHRSKSAFKLKQYLNNGVPVLSTNLMENNIFIKDGTNGFLCETTADYIKRILEINEMSQVEYMKLSTSSRLCIPKFNVEHYAEKLLSSYKAG